MCRIKVETILHFDKQPCVTLSCSAIKKTSFADLHNIIKKQFWSHLNEHTQSSTKGVRLN